MSGETLAVSLQVVALVLFVGAGMFAAGYMKGYVVGSREGRAAARVEAQRAIPEAP